jgi:hypothetical protein
MQNLIVQLQNGNATMKKQLSQRGPLPSDVGKAEPARRTENADPDPGGGLVEKAWRRLIEVMAA